MTLDEAKALKNGSTIFHATKVDSRGHSVRYKVTSVKTWKTRPEHVQLGLKYGLYAYEKIDESHLALVTKEATK